MICSHQSHQGIYAKSEIPSRWFFLGLTWLTYVGSERPETARLELQHICCYNVSSLTLYLDFVYFQFEFYERLRHQS